MAELKKADPGTYERVFVTNPDGALVLQDLLARFHDRKMWAPGGEEGRRETERRAAEAGVLRFILGRLGQLPADQAQET